MFDQLKNLKQFAGMLGNAGELREKFETLQRELAAKTVEAEAGAGAVRVVANGKLEIVSITLDRPLVQTLAGTGAEADAQMVQDLVTAAVNAALARARQLVQDEMRKITGGMNLPGLDQMLSDS